MSEGISDDSVQELPEPEQDGYWLNVALGVEPNDICGIYGHEITDSFADLLGRAIGTRMAGGRVVVGGDLRPSTPSLKESLIAGLLSTGCEVYDVGILPTPALYFAKDRFWADGAVMVTASHRSLEENGFKVMMGKLPSTAVEVRELEEAAKNKGPFASGAGRLYIRDTLKPYASFLIARFVPAAPLKVVVDAGNGSMRLVAVPVLRSLGYEVIEYTYPSDEHFVPDPSLAENQRRLAKIVQEQHAHLGVAYDGDGDRVVFVNERGRPLTAEMSLLLFVQALLLHQPGSQVVYDVSFAPFVADKIREFGGKPAPLKLASAELERALLERGAVLGADRWGHYMFRTMGGDDALYATLVMLRFISRHDNRLEPLVAPYADQ